jgi:dTDP-4-dehydrorhamnose reductase
MILLLGASGYVGQTFSSELRRRRLSFIPLTRKAINYTDFDILFTYVRNTRPEFVINAAGYTPDPNVDACEFAHWDLLCANVLLPQTIARVCLMTNTPWGHVSSGNIYMGAKVEAECGQIRIERDLNRPEIRQLFNEHPEKVHGFTEWDEPNFSFRHAPCNFYSGTKALAEETIRGVGQSYIWRPRMLFDERDDPRNLLSKLQHFDRVYDTVNSMSHMGEFVQACLAIWERQAPFGIYNIVNSNAISTRRVVEMIRQFLKPARDFLFWKDDEEFYRCRAKVPRSNCILDASKLRLLGVKMRPVEVALGDALERWHTTSFSAEFARAGVR